ADGLGRKRMGHVRLDPGISEEIGEPAPAVRRLEGHAERAGLEFAEDMPEVIGAARDAAAEQHRPVLGQGGDDGALAVQIDSEIHHDWASILSFVIWRSFNRCEHGSGGPLLHGIRRPTKSASEERPSPLSTTLTALRQTSMFSWTLAITP